MLNFALLITALVSFLFTGVSFADVSSITEEDASPDVYPWQVKFPNGSVTDNSDGTVSVDFSAGSGDVTDVGDCDGTTCFTTAGDGTTLYTNSDFILHLDNNANGSNKLSILDGADAEIMSLTEAGLLTAAGGLAVGTSGNERFEFTTSGEYIDGTTNSIILLQGVSGSDNTNIQFDLDGTHPVISSPTDSLVEIAEGLSVTGSITNIEGALTDGTILEADLKAVDAAADEECLSYESTGGDFEWQACGAGGATAWDDIGDPDADATIAFAGYEQTITSTLDEASHVALKLDHTDADVANATTLLQIQSVDSRDASLTYLKVVGDSGGTPNTVFSVAGDRTLITGETNGSGEGPLHIDYSGTSNFGAGITLDASGATDGDTWNIFSTGSVASTGGGELALFNGGFMGAWNGSAQQIVGKNNYNYEGQLTVYPLDASTKGIVIEGFASATADLLEVQDSNDVELFNVAPDGGVVILNQGPSANDTIFQIGTSDDADRFKVDEDGDLTLDGTINAALSIASGVVGINNGATTAGVLRILEDSDDGSDYASFTVPALAASTAYTLPADDGDAGEQLQTDGSGVLTWEAAGGAGATAWDDIADPDADATIAFAGYKQTITSSLDEASAAMLTIDHTDADVANATTILLLKSVDDADADLSYISVIDDSVGTPNEVFKVGSNGNVTLDGTITGLNTETISNPNNGLWEFDFSGASATEDFTLGVGSTSNRIVTGSNTGVTQFQFAQTDLYIASMLLSNSSEILRVQYGVNNQSTKIYVIPKGTVAGSDVLISGIKVFGSDFIADSTNYNDFGIYNTDTFTRLNAKCNGSVSCLPILFSTLDNGMLAYLDLTGHLAIGYHATTETAPTATLDLIPAAVSSVTAEGANTIALLSRNQTQTLTDGSTIAALRQNKFLAPTINGVAGGGTETITAAATVYIDGAPSGSDITISNAYSLWVDAGDAKLDGNLIQEAGTTLFMGGLLDATGAVDMDYGSADITDHTFVTDGTGNTEIVLPNDSIGDAEVSITMSHVFPIQSAKLTGSFVTDGDATQGATLDAGEGHWKLLFDATTDEAAVWQWRLPDYAVAFSELNLMYSMASGTANEVEWEAAIMCVTPGDSADIATASFAAIAVASDTVPGTAGYLDEVSITITDDSCAPGDLFWLYVSTDSDDATNDDATGDRELVGVELEYTR